MNGPSLREETPKEGCGMAIADAALQQYRIAAHKIKPIVTSGIENCQWVMQNYNISAWRPAEGVVAGLEPAPAVKA